MDSTQFNNIIYLKELKNPLFIGVSKDFDTSKGCKIATTKLGYFSCSTKGKSLFFLPHSLVTFATKLQHFWGKTITDLKSLKVMFC